MGIDPFWFFGYGFCYFCYVAPYNFSEIPTALVKGDYSGFDKALSRIFIKNTGRIISVYFAMQKLKSQFESFYLNVFFGGSHYCNVDSAIHVMLYGNCDGR